MEKEPSFCYSLAQVKQDYHIEELLSQSANIVVYRATGKGGQTCALTRIVLSDEMASNLSAEQFEDCLEKVKALVHPCLRSVLDGGQDEVDHQPWFVTQWWDGETLESRLTDEKFSGEDLELLKGQAYALIETIGPHAGAITFQPVQIVRTSAADGSAIETFTIDLHQWVDDWAMGSSPGCTVNPQTKLDHLANLVKGPPLARPVFPPVIEPPGVTRVASAQSSGGLGKVLLLMGILSVLAIGGIFFAMNRMHDASEEIAHSDPEKGASSQPAETSPAVQPLRKIPREGRPPKPLFSELETNRRVFADDEARLAEFSEKWVNVVGRVRSVSDQGEWLFESLAGSELPLKARLDNATDLKIEGKIVNVVGFLDEGNLLKIPRFNENDFIDENDYVAERWTFGVDEEQGIIARAGESVRLVGRVTSIEDVGSAILLHFKEDTEREVLAAEILKSDFSKTQNLPFFEAVVGREVGVVGEVAVSPTGRGHFLKFEHNKDFELLEEVVQSDRGADSASSATTAQEEVEVPLEVSYIDAGDRSARAGEVGNLIELRGRVEKVGSAGQWTFESGSALDEPLEARARKGKLNPEVVGRLVLVTGVMRTADQFIIENPGELVILEEEVAGSDLKGYSVEDEAIVRSKAGESVTLQGEVLEFDSSQSGRTLYLNFTERRPVLAAMIQVSAAEEGLDQEYLEALVGKKISVTGLAKEEYGGHRFVIRITRKDQIKQ